MKIAFLGTPKFAVPSLKILQSSDHTVMGVVTVPDKPAGRGRQIHSSAIKEAALGYGMPVLQPENLRDETFIQELQSWNADLFVVVAFRILPEIVFQMPPQGTFNLHASLLPKYRGAAPINWALINGEKETGLTTFFIDKNIDTGEILLQRSLPIDADKTAGELHDALSIMGAELVLETVNDIAAGTLKPQKQVGEVTLAPKLTKELGKIDWTQSALKCHNLIRGLSPVPASYTMFRGRRLKILRSRLCEAESHAEAPGCITAVGKNGPIDVQTSDGLLSILQVKPEGKKMMTAGEFIRGSRIDIGEKFD